MAVSSLNPTDLEEGAVKLQNKFLEEYADSLDDFDPRDVDRIRYNVGYVQKFLTQKMGDIDEAMKMMVECMKWRKSFGVQDMHYTKLEVSLVHLGLAYHHGNDREGNTLIVLNCHLHKKDAKKLPELEKFFVFALESHARAFPDKKVTLIFNMSQCGLTNMDMEFVKIIINCFKFYFPMMLGYLLIFEMPWLLQAAWKIIKGWLSEGGVRKIKFVTKSDITDYVSPDQLLTPFGGEDTWEFDSDEYIEELKSQVGTIWSIDPIGAPPPPDIDHETKEEEMDTRDDKQEVVLRQVRFAPGQSPTHQTRYGKEEDMEYYSKRKSLDPQLLRGTAASPGYRRRMVNRLINTQQQGNRTLMLSNSIDYGSLPSSTDRRKLPGYLMISPEDELVFVGEPDKELYSRLELTNTSSEPIAYKIKTTAPKRYKVRPNVNLIEPNSQTHVQVQLCPNTSDQIAQDKFLVQTYKFDAGTTPPDPASLTDFWKQLEAKDVYEHRMRCRYSNEVVERPINEAMPTPESSLPVQSKKEQSYKLLCRKVDGLSNDVKSLQETANLMKYFLMVTILLLFLILLILIL